MARAGTHNHEMSFHAPAVHFVGGCGYGFRAHAFGVPRNDSGAYASPDVSNIAASSDSRADLPAQTTNWNAWK